jgi:hypothetical protein
MKPEYYLLESGLEAGQLILFNDHRLVIQVLDDEIMKSLVDLEYDGLDGRIALDKDAWPPRSVNVQRARHCHIPLTAFGMLACEPDL